MANDKLVEAMKGKLYVLDSGLYLQGCERVAPLAAAIAEDWFLERLKRVIDPRLRKVEKAAEKSYDEGFDEIGSLLDDFCQELHEIKTAFSPLCERCDGEGKVYEPIATTPNGDEYDTVSCPDCQWYPN